MANAREELIALRRMAELEAKAQRSSAKPKREFGKEKRAPDEYEPKTLGDVALEGAKGAAEQYRKGLTGVLAGFPAFGEKLIRAAGLEEELGVTPGRSRQIIAEAAGMEPTSPEFGLGEFAVEMAGTAGLPGAMAKPLARTFPTAAAYIRGAGFVPKEQLAKNALVSGAGRVAAGAATAAPVSYVLSPEDVGTGTAIGAGLPALAPAGRAALAAGSGIASSAADAIYRAINPVSSAIMERISPEKVAEIQALLRNPREFIPGAQSPVSELSAPAGSAEFASLSKGVEALASDAGVQRDLQNALAREQQGMRSAIAAGAQQQQAMQAISPTVSDDILRALQDPAAARSEAERAAIMESNRRILESTIGEQKAATNALFDQSMAERAAARQNALMAEQKIAGKAATQREKAAAKAAEVAAKEAELGKTLPKVSPMETGEEILSRGEELTKEAQERISAAYKEAYKTMPSPVDISAIQQEATKLGQSLSSLRSKNMSEKGREALLSGNAQFLKLPDVIELRNEASSRLRSALSGEKTDQREVAALRDVIDRIDDTIIYSSAIPKKTVLALERAKQMAFKEKIQKFYQGIGGELLAEGGFGRQMLLPEDLFSKVLNKEQYATEFVRSFADDRQAMDAFKNGVLDLYRRKVMTGGTFDPAKSAKFLEDNQDTIKILDRAGLGIGKEVTVLNKQAQGFAAKKGTLEQRITQIAQEEKDKLAAIAADAKKADEEIRRGYMTEKKDLTAAQRIEREKIRNEGREALRQSQAKYATVLGFKSADDMRRSVLSDPRQIGQLSGFMDEGTRRQFARDLVADVVGKDRSNIGKSLADNERAVKAALKIADPENADRIFSQLTQLDVTQRVLQDAAKVVKGRATPLTGQVSAQNKMAAQKRIDELTKGFSPDELVDAKRIVDDASRAALAGELASRGSFKAEHLASKAIEDEIGGKSLVPQTLNRFNSLVNFFFGRFKNKIDRGTAAELVLLWQDPKKVADLLDEATKMKMPGQRIESAVETIKKTGAAASRAAPVIYGSSQE